MTGYPHHCSSFLVTSSPRSLHFHAFIKPVLLPLGPLKWRQTISSQGRYNLYLCVDINTYGCVDASDRKRGKRDENEREEGSFHVLIMSLLDLKI